MEGQHSRGSGFSEDAFQRFFEDTLPDALSAARRMCGSDEDAKDACQHAYLAVYRYWSAGRLREPPRHLLFRAVQRSAVDTLRARLRRERHLGHGDLGAPAPGAIGGPLDRALRRLDPNDAALIVLQAVAGMTYEELAQIQRTSVSAVRSRLFRARRALARQYEAEGGEW